MKNMIKQNINIIFVCILEILIGVLLLVDANAFTAAVIVICGIALMAAGLYSSVKYFKESALVAASGQLLMIGLMLLLSGAFCVFRANWFIETLPILTVIYGVVTLAIGFCKVQVSVDSIRAGSCLWFLYGISAVLSIVCSLVVFANPFGEDKLATLWIFTGISLLVLCALDIASLVCIKTLAKKAKKEEKAPESLPEEK